MEYQLFKNTLFVLLSALSSWFVSAAVWANDRPATIELASVDITAGAGQEVNDSGPLVQPEINFSKKKQYEPSFVAVPFVFSTETMGFTAGGAGVLKHAGQVQASVFGAGFYSANSSWVTFLGVNNYQIPTLDQWLFSGEFYRASFTEGIYFVSDSSNSSGPNSAAQVNRVVTKGDEAYSKLHIKYVLPWGKGANGAARSLMPSRPDAPFSWDPRQSGVTSIQLTPFSKTRQLVGYEHIPDESQGLALKFEWDNRDNGKNSTRGGRTRLTFSKDFGSSGTTDIATGDFDGRDSWSTWEFEQSAFVSLGDNTWLNEQTLAFNFYLADTPSWNEFDAATSRYDRPPSFAGITLGGFEHLRGYSSKQLFGRSAVLYSAEYRMQPKWQPLQTLPVFNLYNVPWWQWVVFAEAGQVSDDFSASSLHQDMKWTLGAGVRFEVESVVVRAEFAYGGESNQFWVMVNQPF